VFQLMKFNASMVNISA